MRRLLMLALGMGTACGSSPEPSETSKAASTTAIQPVACSAKLVASVDKQSLASHNEVPPSQERIDRFAREAGERFKSVADEMCRQGQIDPTRFARFRTLLIQSASGATETAIYEDQANFPHTLIFQWVFVEEDLGLPAPDDISDGLVCWNDPEASLCADRMP